MAQFDGGDITSDAGGLLLREVEQRTGIIRQFAACFTDHRDPESIERTVNLNAVVAIFLGLFHEFRERQSCAAIPAAEVGDTIESNFHIMFTFG